MTCCVELSMHEIPDNTPFSSPSAFQGAGQKAGKLSLVGAV